MTVEVREAAPDDRLSVRRVLDAAMLVVRDDLPARIDAGDVLVACEARGTSERRGGKDAPRPSDRASGDSCEQTAKPRAGQADDAPVVGALVLVTRDDDGHVGDDGAHIDAVAVRRARRGRGVGSALVRTAAERHAPLTAEFDSGLRPFYESLGFDISHAADDDRLRGRYDGSE